jgi:hypothetical protein
MKRIILLFLSVIVALLSGCSDENPYSGYRANFVFDGSIHPYNQARSFGQYICVRRGVNIGQFRLTDARGNTTVEQVPEIHLQQGLFNYGLGGLIIGTPSAYGEGALIAYDWACPNCQLERYRVVIDYVMGYATCPNPKCGVKFDLNSGGIAIEGKSDPLMRYRIIDNGSTVIVQN